MVSQVFTDFRKQFTELSAKNAEIKQTTDILTKTMKVKPKCKSLEWTYLYRISSVRLAFTIYQKLINNLTENMEKELNNLR